MPPAQIAAALPRPRAITLILAILLSAVLALSARVHVPFWPVPMTLQTLAVLTIGGLGGPVLGVASVAVYLAEGAAGLAVFSGTPLHGIGLAYLLGPTGGYLVGMLPAAAIAGIAGRRFAGQPLQAGLCMLAAAAVIYACGVAWLAGMIGWPKAWALGAVPFLLADAVKVALATALVSLRRREG